LKFKYLVIIFSVFMFFIILSAILLPLLLAGPEFFKYIQHFILPLVAFLVLILIIMSLFFLFNYRLFSLLEREDWPALSFYLEKQIFEKGRYSSRNVRLLASSYLVISDYSSVIKLEKKALSASPSAVRENVLVFGSARILNGNHNESAAFFKSYTGKGKKNENLWIQWFYGFSLLLSGDFSSAEPEFVTLVLSSGDALIIGLSSYFLDNAILKHSMKTKECANTAESGKQQVRKSLKNLKGWQKEIDKMGTDIHAAIIKKYFDEAGRWIFSL